MEKKRINGIYSLKKVFQMLSFFILFVLFGTSYTFAFTSPEATLQKKVISGIVKDKNGEPVIGANIVEKGTSNGVISDLEGKFSLNVSSSGKIEVSFIGYVTQVISIGNKSKIDVILLEDAQSLEEVVVVGYGSQKKVNMTGAVAAVKIDDKITSRPLTNVSSGLSGLVPGLSVQQSTGMAGANSATLLVRGLGTVNNASPLVVVDGMPDVDINRINPNDIESISVLKDAASAAVYGSRAANGVILITTKTGAGSNKSTVSYSGNFAFSNPTKWYDPMDDYSRSMTLLQQGARAGNYAEQYRDGTVDRWLSGSLVDPILFPNTNWKDIVLRTGKIQSHNVSLTQGGEKFNAFLSIGVMDEQGMQIYNDYTRYNFRANMDMKPRKGVTIGARFDGQWTDLETPRDNGFGGGGDGPTGNFFSIPGILPQHPDGRYGGLMAWGETMGGGNLLAHYRENHNETQRKEFNGNVYGEIEFIKGLKARIDYGMSYYNNFKKVYSMPTKVYNFQDPNSAPTDIILKSAGISNTSSEGYKTLLQGRLSYENTFAEKHYISALFAATEEFWFDRNLSASRNDRVSPSLTEIDGALTVTQKTGGNSSSEGLRSFLGRINYVFADRYLVELNARYDGSSKFSKGHQWGFFPSASLGWRFMEESFMENLKSYVSSGKLRASLGKLGNNSGVGRYEQRNTLKVTNYTYGGSVFIGQSPYKMINEDFSWESTRVFNVGLDLGFFDNKLTAEFDFYDRLTTDMIRPSEISVFFSGYSAPKRNIGTLRNRGFEVNLNYNDNVGDFTYSVNFNASYNQSRLEKWNQIINAGDSNSGHYIYLDMPYGFIYTSQDLGIAQTWMDIHNAPYQGRRYTAPGDVLYADLNGDGQYTTADRKVVSANYNQKRPTGNYGLNLYGAWKGIDLNILFQGTTGRKDFWIEPYNCPETEPRGAAFTWDYWNGEFWSIDHRDASLPRYVTNQSKEKGYNRNYSTFWLQNMNYLRLKSLQVGYTLPQEWMDAVQIKTIRIFASADNLLTLTKWKGIDPEKSTDGDNPYPLMRTISFGVKANF